MGMATVVPLAIAFVGDIVASIYFETWVQRTNDVYFNAFDRGLQPHYGQNHFLIGFGLALAVLILTSFCLGAVARLSQVRSKNPLKRLRPLPNWAITVTAIGFLGTLYNPVLGPIVLLIGVWLLVRWFQQA